MRHDRTYEAEGQELVDRGEGEARDWSSRVLGANHFQEGSQENVGFHVGQF